MSIMITYTLHCDGENCEAYWDGHEGAEATAVLAAACEDAGWSVTEKPWGRVLCGVCTELRNQIKGEKGD